MPRIMRRLRYLSTVLDDFSRYIIAWKLCSTIRAEDVTDTLGMALQASGCDSAQVIHKPRLLSDNDPSYIAGELAKYIEAQKMSHVRGAPFHPQTQGKIWKTTFCPAISKPRSKRSSSIITTSITTRA